MPNDVYIKQADAVFAVQNRIEQIGMENNPYVCSIRQAVRDVPAADVETVVRCRDCKFASMTYDGECKYCACFGSKDEYGELDPELYLPSDFFCAFGVRKEVDDAVSCN